MGSGTRGVRAPIAIARIGLAACVAIGVVACAGSDRAPRDAPCSFNSDCADGLVCAGQACRAECAEDRDCPLGWTCGASGTARVRACLPPASPVLCAYQSECPPGAACIERQCRAECLADRDCPSGACVSGICDRALVTPSAPDGGVGADGAACRMCGARCIDVLTHPQHCGACGRACASGEYCASGACMQTSDCAGPDCCPAYWGFCDGACVDTSSDARHCGDCGRACTDGAEFRARYCVGPEDDCEGAIEVTLAPSAGLSGTLIGRDDSPASCGLGADVFYRFQVNARSLVYVGGVVESDTGGGVGIVGIAPGACGSAPRCSEMSATPSIVAVLDPGSYLAIVDSAYEGEAFYVAIEAIPIGGAIPLPLAAGTSTVDGTTVAGPSAPGSCGGGPERVYFWTSVASDPGGVFRASSCGGASFDTVLQLVHGDGLEGACDGRDACGAQSSIEVALFPRAGLHALFVDGEAATDHGAFSVVVERP